jgi:hypothetical protein
MIVSLLLLVEAEWGVVGSAYTRAFTGSNPCDVRAGFAVDSRRYWAVGTVGSR